MDLKRVFCCYISLLLLSLASPKTSSSQPPGGGSDQSQLGQMNQAGQQGAQTGGQAQQGLGRQQGQDFGQGPGQGQQAGQMQDMISQRLKELLGSTDEEWTVIGPRALKVYSHVSSQSSGIQMRSLTGRSGSQDSRSRGGNRSYSSEGDVALEELQTLLESEETTITQIKNKVSEVRKEKEEARQALARAQKELRELLTLKQEAILISIGMLE